MTLLHSIRGRKGVAEAVQSPLEFLTARLPLTAGPIGGGIRGPPDASHAETAIGNDGHVE